MRLYLIVSCLAAACSGGNDLSISISADKLSFAAVWSKDGAGMEQQRVTVSFTGEELGVTTPPDMEMPGWLTIEPVGMPDTGGPARAITVQITASPYARNAGSYSTVLRFVTIQGKQTAFADLPVELAIADALTLQGKGSDPVIGATVGSPQFSNAVSVDVASSQASWQATIDQPWLRVSPSSGSGSQTLTISAIPNQLPAGSHVATLTVASADRRLSATLALTLAVDGARWWPARPAVGFAATNNLTSLRETIPLAANVDLATLGLAAHSDAAWLTASLAGSQLILIADPTGMPDGLHLGSVTLPSASVGDRPPPTVRVSLYKLGATIGAQDPLVAPADIRAAIDPLRPRIYVGATAPTRIEGYDLYTGARQLVTVPPRSDLRIWQVSPDGRYLLMRQPIGPDAWGPTVFPLDLDTETWLAPYDVNPSVDLPQFTLGGIALSRINQFADGDGQPYQEIGAYEPPSAYSTRYFTDPAGSKWFVETSQTDGSDNRIAALDVQVYQRARKIAFRGLQTGTLPPRTGNTRDFTNQGHRIWFGYGWVDYDPAAGFGPVHTLPQVLTMPGNNPADPVEFSMNERGESMVLWFGVSPLNGPGYAIAHYDAEGSLTRSDSVDTSALSVGRFASSPRTPDGFRWVTLTSSGSSGAARQITSQ